MLLSNNINGAQHVDIKAIYKNYAAVCDVRVQKHNTVTTQIEKIW